MRRLLPLFVWTFGAWIAAAQGVPQAFSCFIRGFEYVAGATNPVSGFGTLYLQGKALGYNINVPHLQNLPAEAHFHSDNTDLRVSLNPYVYVPPNTSWPGGIVFDGTLNVTDFFDQLIAGHWYVQIHSPNYENGVVRGYVIPVPEPTVLTLALAGLAIACLSVRAKTRSRFRTRRREDATESEEASDDKLCAPHPATRQFTRFCRVVPPMVTCSTAGEPVEFQETGK